MHRRRIIIAAAVAVLVGGSAAWTAGYGLHARSDAYRAEVAAELSEFFELPCDVGRIRPQTFSSRLFEDVIVWLPNRRDRIFECRRAVWHEHEHGDVEVNELELADGTLVLGTDRWQSGDYRQVFESGLGHDFQDLSLSRVQLSEFEIAFERGPFAIRCRNTSGVIDMSNPTDGVARLTADELNGRRISQGVQIDARFSPRNGVEVHELFLELPDVPLETTGIGAALGTTVTRGRFAGGVEYRRGDGEPEVWIRGDLTGADLAELTAPLPFGPLIGTVSVNVWGARVSQSVVTHLRGRGEVSGLAFSAFAPLLGVPTLSGTAELSVQEIDLALGHVNRLSLSGFVGGVSLEEMLQPFGIGSATGTLSITVHGLRVEHDRIRSADIEIRVSPPPGRPGTIDQTLLLGAAETILDFTWPDLLPRALLPSQIEYVDFGVRLLVRDNQLRILGTHGADGKTILTIRVLRNAIELVRERPDVTDLTPWIEDLGERIRSYDPRRVRDWWESASPFDGG